MGIFRVVDWPPVWLALFVGVAWFASMPVFDGAAARFLQGLGWAAVGGGAVLMALAAREMARAGTTIVPGRDPARIVTRGVFGLSRNPIYLGDLLILAGLALIWQSWIGLVLVPVLGRILAQRFIREEEARLRAGFGEEAEAYMARVRRWI
jgi:protein-S-isoprenylcysteine O-methyltransferase Ste14